MADVGGAPAGVSVVGGKRGRGHLRQRVESAVTCDAAVDTCDNGGQRGISSQSDGQYITR
jgi:hypothetical protein